MLFCSGFTRSRKAKLAISSYFFSMGCTLGCWAGVLPHVKSDHQLNNASLGGILVAAIFGAIFALPVVTYISEKYGSGFSLLIGGTGLLILYPLVGIKSHIALLIIGIFFLGFGAGWADVSMNAQAVVCEKMTRTTTVGLFHSLMAIGGLAGALYAGLLMDKGHSVLQTTVLLSLLQLFPLLFVSWWLYSPQEQKLLEQNCFIQNDYEYEKIDAEQRNGTIIMQDPDESILSSSQSKGSTSSASAALLLNQAGGWQDFNDLPPTINYTILGSISCLCFISYFGQGSVGDWSAIYLSNDINAGSFECTFAFAAFELFVAIGTFFSDWFVMRFGRKLLLQLSGIISAVGLSIAVIATSVHGYYPSLFCAIIGFSISGLGLSVVPPCVVSIAGSGITGMSPDRAIAYVSSFGYVGIMVGPPFLGMISELSNSLRWSFAVDAGIMLLITIISIVYKLGVVRRVSKASSVGNDHHEVQIIQ